MGFVALVIVDVDKHGHVEHAVCYRQVDGSLQGILGSYEPGPFDGWTDMARWLANTLWKHGRSSPS